MYTCEHKKTRNKKRIYELIYRTHYKKKAIFRQYETLC